MNKKLISAVIVAHNEEKKIADCLASLDFVDEIIVVLDKCSDKTKEIVQKFNAKIIEGSWNIEGMRRNIAVGAASFDWVLEIDADERISKELAAEILSAVRNSPPCAFIIPIANYVGKRWVKHGWLRVLGVLGRQTLTYRGLKKYHEDKEVHPTYDLNGQIKLLKNPIIHLVDKNISDLLSRFNRYTSWRANDIIFKKRSGVGLKSGIFYFLIGFKIRFFKSFIIKKGYKEGGIGLLIALLAALYPLISYLKAKEKLSNEDC
jgi:glycosyltransferase involved in cell wall biosynthesis